MDVALELETVYYVMILVYGVSILVLVDVALELIEMQTQDQEVREFQSLFSWMSLLNSVEFIKQCYG